MDTTVLYRLLLIAAVTLPLILTGCGGGGEETETGADTTATVDTVGTLIDQSIVEVLTMDPRFSMFLASLDSTGLTSAFEDDTPMTVFVPTNDAFAAVLAGNRDRMRDIILYHAVQEDFSTRPPRPGDTLTTLQGDDLVIAADSTQAAAGGTASFTINGIPVTDPNVQVSNGKIYVINQPLTPPAPAEF